MPVAGAPTSAFRTVRAVRPPCADRPGGDRNACCRGRFRPSAPGRRTGRRERRRGVTAAASGPPARTGRPGRPGRSVCWPRPPGCTSTGSDRRLRPPCRTVDAREGWTCRATELEPWHPLIVAIVLFGSKKLPARHGRGAARCGASRAGHGPEGGRRGPGLPGHGARRAARQPVRTGSDRWPCEMNESTGGSPCAGAARVRPGNRSNRAGRATRASSRPSGAPRQWWTPYPKAR